MNSNFKKIFLKCQLNLKKTIMNCIRFDDRLNLLKCLSECSLNDLSKAGILCTAIAEEITLEMIKVLLDNGFDVNTPDYFNRTPLIYSMYNRNDTILNYLVSRGALLDPRTKKDRGSKKDTGRFTGRDLNPGKSYYINLNYLVSQFFSVGAEFCYPRHEYSVEYSRRLAYPNIQKFYGNCKFSLACKTKIISKFVVFDIFRF